MRKTAFVLAFITLILASIWAEPAMAQTRKGNMRTEEILSLVKPGQWAKLEGVAQKNMTILCKEVEILTGDFHNDDWEAVGTIREIDTEEKTFKVFLLPVKLDKDIEFDSAEENFKSFADLRAGMYVEIEGTFLKDSTFLALEIEDESAKVKEEPALKDAIDLVGRIQKVDVGSQTITMMGMTFQLTEQTKGKSVIK